MCRIQIPEADMVVQHTWTRGWQSLSRDNQVDRADHEFLQSSGYRPCGQSRHFQHRGNKLLGNIKRFQGTHLSRMPICTGDQTRIYDMQQKRLQDYLLTSQAPPEPPFPSGLQLLSTNLLIHPASTAVTPRAPRGGHCLQRHQ
jgi:hypothetical protein